MLKTMEEYLAMMIFWILLPFSDVTSQAMIHQLGYVKSAFRLPSCLDQGDVDIQEFAQKSRAEQQQMQSEYVGKMSLSQKIHYAGLLMDPIKNLEYAARYLRFLYEVRSYSEAGPYGSYALWLSDYNRGSSTFETPTPYGMAFYKVAIKFNYRDKVISVKSNPKNSTRNTRNSSNSRVYLFEPVPEIMAGSVVVTDDLVTLLGEGENDSEDRDRVPGKHQNSD